MEIQATGNETYDNTKQYEKYKNAKHTNNTQTMKTH